MVGGEKKFYEEKCLCMEGVNSDCENYIYYSCESYIYIYVIYEGGLSLLLLLLLPPVCLLSVWCVFF